MRLQDTLIILIIMISAGYADGQTPWLERDTKSIVRKEGRDLDYPWAGGLNATQYGKIDLDGDGVEDLVVFDRTTSKLSTFIADPVRKQYRYQPGYESKFPRMFNWMLLVDYDGDGVKELFTYVGQGITVYKKEEDPVEGWRWVNFKEYLQTVGLSGNKVNLQVVAADIPALVDFDGDGDLDVIAFEAGGDYIELNQNMSMERYGVPDSLEFRRNGECWGNFRKHTCDDFVFGVNCGVDIREAGNARVTHAGNALLLYDFNGDGKKDMLLGNVDCENLSIVYNDAGGLAANFSSYRSTYPEESPAVMPMFPAPYLEDVDFDGVKDLLVSPNVYGNDNFRMDFIASGWYYHNAGSDENPDFRLKQKDFLQSEMVDVGENAFVSFFDVDGDGDMDMIIGNRGRLKGDLFRGTLWLYLNTGTPENPVYELETDDYLGLSGLEHTDLQPQWLDFNGDGIPDLGFASVYNRVTRYYYIPNRGGGGTGVRLNHEEKVEISLPSTISISDRVYFYDYDKDGDADLLVGGVLGNIMLYENKGTIARPEFLLADQALGGMGPSFSRRYLSLAAGDLDMDGNDDLVMVDQSGRLSVLYGGEWGQWTKRDSAIIKSEFGEDVEAPFLGGGLTVTIADIDRDRKPDIAVGTGAGGLHLFRNVLPVVITGREPSGRFTVYPNPADDAFFVGSDKNADFEVYDFTGRHLHAGRVTSEGDTEVSTVGWQKGLYLVRLNVAPGIWETKRLIVAPAR